MKATQFIKDHGLERAREVIDGAPEGCRGYNDVIHEYTKGVWFSRDVLLSDLKRLVEPVDLVESYGGVGMLEYQVRCLGQEIPEHLKQAISNYESIYGEGNE